MKIQRSSKESEALLRSLVPPGKGISLRPMFGNLSAFTGGNMFMGVYGEDFFVRLSDSDRLELLKDQGASIFEPVAGRKMKEYVVVPRAWKGDAAKIRPWVSRAVEWVGKMPAKKPKKR